MSPSQSFQLANTTALIGWIVLLAFPNSRMAVNLVRNGRLSMILALAYVVALGLSLSELPPGSGFGELSAVKALFSNDWALLAGWIHYLAFDLIMGSRAIADNQGRSRAIVTAILILIFMFGPVGWLLSEVTKPITKKGV